MPYVIVEQSGYVGERDVHQTEDYWDALDWMRRNYAQEETTNLHVDIAFDSEDGRTYEVC